MGTSCTVVDVNGTTLMPAKELMFPAGYAWDLSGTRSPDGSTIAWAEGHPVKYRSGNLHLMSPSGGDSKRLADWALMPAWASGAEVSPSPSASPSP